MGGERTDSDRKSSRGGKLFSPWLKGLDPLAARPKPSRPFADYFFALFIEAPSAGLAELPFFLSLIFFCLDLSFGALSPMAASPPLLTGLSRK